MTLVLSWMNEIFALVMCQVYTNSNNYSWLSIVCKKNFWGQNGVEAGIHANYVTIYVLKHIGVDAKKISECD